MLGTIIYKNKFDAELYSNCALWANNNNAELVESEDCYVVHKQSHRTSQQKQRKLQILRSIMMQDLKH